MDVLNLRTARRPYSRRHRRIRPYLFHTAHTSLDAPVPPSLLHRVLQGLRSLPDRAPVHVPSQPPRDDRTPLVRFIDSELARTAPDRTPTVEFPLVGEGVSWR